MNSQQIGFIGGGNMARSLIGGLINNDWPSAQIACSDSDRDKLQSLADRFGIVTFDSNDQLIDHCDVIVLAVKPQVLHGVLQADKQILQQKTPLLISIAAGVHSQTILHWLGVDVPLVRTMPNTPALVGTGATALVATANVSAEQHQLAESLMRSVGVVVWLDNEDQLDAITALSGSGPAYFMLFMESLERAAIEAGIEPNTARLLTLQTCLGTAKLAMESGEQLSILRNRVTSPGGTTEQAINSFISADLESIVKQAFSAAQQRSKQLAKELAENT